MKCCKCKVNNITKANHCKKCGYKFSKEEKKKARSKTFVGKLERLEKVYEVCTLKIITDHIAYKIISFLIVLGIGIYFLVTYGLNVRFLNSKNYEIKYNEELKEYYIITDKNKISLDLYIPNRTKNIAVVHYDEKDTLIEETNYKPSAKIILQTKENDYYIINPKYSNDTKDSFKLYVLKKEL